MFGKVIEALMAAIPGVVKFIDLFKKKSYTGEEIDKKVQSELEAIRKWREGAAEDRKLVDGE